MDGRRGRQKGDGPAAIEINIGGTSMGVSENARLVLETRYLIKDADGKAIESVDGMFQRVAGAIAASDLLHDKNADVERT